MVASIWTGRGVEARLTVVDPVRVHRPPTVAPGGYWGLGAILVGTRWRLAMVSDQGEGSDILDAIVAEGRCGTCGTPWDRVVNVDGKRPVKIEGGCPNEVCVLGDW